jgi:hypothetical protein
VSHWGNKYWKGTKLHFLRKYPLERDADVCIWLWLNGMSQMQGNAPLFTVIACLGHRLARAWMGNGKNKNKNLKSFL